MYGKWGTSPTWCDFQNCVKQNFKCVLSLWNKNETFMIYKTCYIAFWRQEVMLPHPVYRIWTSTICEWCRRLGFFLWRIWDLLILWSFSYRLFSLINAPSNTVRSYSPRNSVINLNGSVDINSILRTGHSVRSMRSYVRLIHNIWTHGALLWLASARGRSSIMLLTIRNCCKFYVSQ